MLNLGALSQEVREQQSNSYHCQLSYSTLTLYSLINVLPIENGGRGYLVERSWTALYYWCEDFKKRLWYLLYHLHWLVKMIDVFACLYLDWICIKPLSTTPFVTNPNFLNRSVSHFFPKPLLTVKWLLNKSIHLNIASDCLVILLVPKPWFPNLDYT